MAIAAALMVKTEAAVLPPKCDVAAELPVSHEPEAPRPRPRVAGIGDQIHTETANRQPRGAVLKGAEAPDPAGLALELRRRANVTHPLRLPRAERERTAVAVLP